MSLVAGGGAAEVGVVVLGVGVGDEDVIGDGVTELVVDGNDVGVDADDAATALPVPLSVEPPQADTEITAETASAVAPRT